jgi:4-hydroxy-tetrahydrodipicolinate reductase
VKFAIHGATGRMGLAILRLARQAGDEVVGGCCSPNDPNAGRDLGELAGIGPIGVVASPDVGSSLLGAEVVIDFSTPSAVPALVAQAARHKVAVMSGTTGLDAAGEQALTRAAESIPVLWAPNTSLGVQVLAELVEQAVKKLGARFDVEIVEIHHRKKIDAPSGTALRLAAAARAGRGELKELHARDGNVGARTDAELGVVAVRGGDVIGDHTVYLLGQGERLELTHRASSRELFAQGALAAARFVAGKAPGRYVFKDVLG